MATARTSADEPSEICRGVTFTPVMHEEQPVQIFNVPCNERDLVVSVCGHRSWPAFITYHDIGMNFETCFKTFLDFPEMKPICKKFCFYNINAPGQEEGASIAYFESNGTATGRHEMTPVFHTADNSQAGTNEPTGEVSLVKNGKAELDSTTVSMSNGAGSVFPTMDQLAEQITNVLIYFGIKRFFGLGVGAGANILTRYTLANPDKVDGLVLVNLTTSPPGWIEWGYQKVNSMYLSRGNYSRFSENYLMWHWLGYRSWNEKVDLAYSQKQLMLRINPTNLAAFIDAYNSRTKIQLHRDPNKGPHLSCPILLVTGDNSPHLAEVCEANAEMDPSMTSFFKVSDCGGLVLNERPDRMAEAIRFYLQGLGYLPSIPSVMPDSNRVSMFLEEKEAKAESKRRASAASTSSASTDRASQPSTSAGFAGAQVVT